MAPLAEFAFICFMRILKKNGWKQECKCNFQNNIKNLPFLICANFPLCDFGLLYLEMFYLRIVFAIILIYWHLFGTSDGNISYNVKPNVTCFHAPYLIYCIVDLKVRERLKFSAYGQLYIISFCHFGVRKHTINIHWINREQILGRTVLKWLEGGNFGWTIALTTVFQSDMQNKGLWKFLCIYTCRPLFVSPGGIRYVLWHLGTVPRVVWCVGLSLCLSASLILCSLQAHLSLWYDILSRFLSTW